MGQHKASEDLDGGESELWLNFEVAHVPNLPTVQPCGAQPDPKFRACRAKIVKPALCSESLPVRIPKPWEDTA